MAQYEEGHIEFAILSLVRDPLLEMDPLPQKIDANGQRMFERSSQQSMATEDDQSMIYSSRQQSIAEGDQTWERPSVTQATSHGSASTNVQRPQARSSRTAQKPKRKSAMLRGLEPYNKSPEPDSESSSDTDQPIALAKRKRNSKKLRKVRHVNKSPDPSSDSEPVKVRHSKLATASQYLRLLVLANSL